jgi:hypothetical protein
MSYTTPCILEPEQYFILYRSSWFLLVSSLFGLYKKMYLDSFIYFVIFLTSINYWRRPDYSWRRYLDMTVAKSTIIYQCYYSYESKYQTYFYFYLLLAISCYKISIYYYHKNEYWKSTYFHFLFHCFINLSIFFLISGKEIA